jgi:predicted transcriptional regulator
MEKTYVYKGGKIFVEHFEIGRIARLFSCTPQTVRNALRGTTAGERADAIRIEALKSGGVEKPKIVQILRFDSSITL